MRVPVCVGEKLTFTRQLSPAASVVPHASFAVVGVSVAKSPVVLIELIFNVEAPVLVSVTVLQQAVSPTLNVPQVSEAGLKPATGPLALATTVS